MRGCLAALLEHYLKRGALQLIMSPAQLLTSPKTLLRCAQSDWTLREVVSLFSENLCLDSLTLLQLPTVPGKLAPFRHT